MALARIIDETGVSDLWSAAIREVLAAAGFSMGAPEDDSAGFTVLLHPADTDGRESRFPGDLLVLSVPGITEGTGEDSGRTEVIGSGRLKVRHRLSESMESSAMADELRPLVNLFLT